MIAGALAVAGGVVGLNYRSHTELVVALTLSGIVAAAGWSALGEVWSRPTGSLVASRVRSGRVAAFRRKARAWAARVPSLRRFRGVRAVAPAYPPHEQLRRKLSMSCASEFDASVHLRPLIEDIVAGSPDAATDAAVRRVLDVPPARIARRDGGGLTKTELEALVAALERS